MRAYSLLTFLVLGSISMVGQVPVGTIIPARLSSFIDTVKNKPGDRITARVMQDVPLGKGGKLPAGTRLMGQIVEVRPEAISWKFDGLIVRKKSVAIRTNLRALASPMEVHDAQLPTNDAGGDRGSSDEDWNTVQIGGDEVVYGRRGGPVMHGSEVVGHSLFRDGVLATPLAQQGSHCRGSVGSEALQAFWLFAASACGVYGYSEIWIAHAGRSDPVGIIMLASRRRIRIAAGSGVLLRVR